MKLLLSADKGNNHAAGAWSLFIDHQQQRQLVSTAACFAEHNMEVEDRRYPCCMMQLSLHPKWQGGGTVMWYKESQLPCQQDASAEQISIRHNKRWFWNKVKPNLHLFPFIPLNAVGNCCFGELPLLQGTPTLSIRSARQFLSHFQRAALCACWGSPNALKLEPYLCIALTAISNCREAGMYKNRSEYFRHQLPQFLAYYSMQYQQIH